FRLDTCSFSGFKIYPGHGSMYIRGDSRSFRFANSKAHRYFLQRLKPSKLDWTTVFRRINKKGAQEATRKSKSRKVTKAPRAVAGATLEDIQAKRAAAPELRALAAAKKASDKKSAADKDAKKVAKKAAKKAAKVAGIANKAAPKVSKQQAKG
ncbi:hypothetical protein CXG81DRAFT_6171, partial [Caulochytrium protostelioides]